MVSERFVKVSLTSILAGFSLFYCSIIMRLLTVGTLGWSVFDPFGDLTVFLFMLSLGFIFYGLFGVLAVAILPPRAGGSREDNAESEC